MLGAVEIFVLIRNALHACGHVCMVQGELTVAAFPCCADGARDDEEEDNTPTEIVLSRLSRRLQRLGMLR